MTWPPQPVEPDAVGALAAHIDVSAELLADVPNLQHAIWQALNWDRLPEEDRRRLEAHHARRQAEQRAERAAQRAATPVTSLTVETLCAALGLTEAQALHRVQAYCDCAEGMDGFYVCLHADDLGVYR